MRGVLPSIARHWPDTTEHEENCGRRLTKSLERRRARRLSYRFGRVGPPASLNSVIGLQRLK